MGTGKSCSPALKRAMRKRKSWEGLERWRRLYMSWFCQIPLSLGSSCRRPNSRGPLLLLTPCSSAPTDPFILDLFIVVTKRNRNNQAAVDCVSILCSIRHAPQPAFLSSPGPRTGRKSSSTPGQSVCWKSPSLVSHCRFPSPKQCIQPHSLAFSRRVDTSSDRSRVRHGGHCATGVLHGYAPEI